MLDDLQHGIWSELSTTARRRSTRTAGNLQNKYLTQINNKLNPPAAQAAQIAQLQALGIQISPLSEDARSELRGELVTLRGEIKAAEGKAANRETRMHLHGADHRIGEILDPKK